MKIIQSVLLLALTGLSALIPQLSAAPVGTAFTYQGRLDDGADPAQGTYDLRFTIYDAASGGGVVGGPLTNAVTGVTNGLFTVALDFGAGAFAGDARWLEVAVQTNGSGAFTTLSPRQPLAPSPYALYAPSAGVAGTATSVSGSVAASQLTGTISSNQIAPASITATMLAAGSVTAAQLAIGAVTTSALQDGAVTAAKMAVTTTVTLLTTIANPTPATNDYFGSPMAAVGNDRVLIGTPSDDTGASDSGAAYLFSTSGTLLQTFTNPTPASYDNFGSSVAAVGNDRVLIGTPSDDTGASDSGAAYLFSTNGTILTTFTNPAPSDVGRFGVSVAALGSDRVLIGAYDDASGLDAGAVYLFSINGTLLRAFANPTPAVNDWFGSSMAAVGSDRVLIAAPYDDTGATDTGAAYLFSTNGTLLRTFANPTPAANDWFGSSVAAVGNDCVLIGAPGDDTGAPNAGVAYLFSTNGTLLRTFTNPTPAANDYFGSVAAVGGDRVLIGARGDDTAATNAGAVYIFSTNGTLLATITVPNPAAEDWAGGLVTAVGNNLVLISQEQNDTGAPNAGAACLFALGKSVPGLFADGVRPAAITTVSLEDSAVTAAKIGAGAVGSSQLASNAVTTANLAAGAVTSVAIADGSINAADINAGSFSNVFWKVDGNSGTTAGTHFLGTTDNQPLELKVNNWRGLRLEPTANTDTVNVIAGSARNFVGAGVVGATIGGGGSGNYGGSASTNRVEADFGTVSGGNRNTIGANSFSATIAGGRLNDIGTDSRDSAIGGGYDNNIAANSAYATVAGGYLNEIGMISSNSVIGGGNGNIIAASSANATIAGGSRNEIGTNSFYSAIGGGDDNNIAANSWYATIMGGEYNNVGTNSGSSAIGGGIYNNIAANAPYATIPGGQNAKASGYGQMAYASGMFVSAGDAQSSLFVARGTTSGLVTGELFLDGSSRRMIVPGNTAWTFEILVAARSSAGEVAAYIINGMISRAGATTYPPVYTLTTLYESDSAWGVSVSADDTNDALVISATGNTGDTIRWVASVRTAEVTY
jgi:hypothetical protein